MLEDKPCTNT